MTARTDAARLCAELVRIRSENPPGNTVEIIHYIKGFLESLGIKSRIIENRGGRYNLVSMNGPASLLLCGHVDVVPAMTDGWSHDPFSGDTADGFVWGRGSTDMKGGCAALLSAFRNLVDRGIEPAADLAFVCDEETSGTYGIQCLLSKRFIRPCDCLIAEPTPSLYPNIGQKGLCRIDFLFTGEPGHGSLYPVKGVSAVMEAVKTLSYLEELHSTEYNPGLGMEDLVEQSERVLNGCFGIDRAGEVLRRIMWNPGKIEGGEKANIVAQHCRLELDIRVPWGCRMEDLVNELVKRAPRAKATIQSLSEPSLTAADTRLVATVCREISRVYGRKSSPIVQWAASDARFLRKAGFSVIEYGPGDITRLHAIDERVPVDALGHAEEVYKGVILEYGNGSEKG